MHFTDTLGLPGIECVAEAAKEDEEGGEEEREELQQYTGANEESKGTEVWYTWKGCNIPRGRGKAWGAKEEEKGRKGGLVNTSEVFTWS